MTRTKHRYVYALDPKVNRRVVHVIINGWAISMVTGHRFRYDDKSEAKKE